MISVMPVPLLSIHPQGCNQQGHIRYVPFACAYRWTCRVPPHIMEKRRIASTAGVRTLCDFCQNQLCRFCEKIENSDLLAKMPSSVASRARRYPLCIFAVMLKHTWQAMHRGTHSCVLVGKHAKPFNNFTEIGYAPLVLKTRIRLSNGSHYVYRCSLCPSVL